MPTITDWLMVGITAVYVVATIFISCANIKSANATRDQLTESKRQYEDKKRLEIMPYIQFEQTKDNANHELNLVLDSGDKLTGEYILLVRMKNIGNGTAKDIAYTYQWNNGANTYDRGAFPVQASIYVDLSQLLLQRVPVLRHDGQVLLILYALQGNQIVNLSAVF